MRRITLAVLGLLFACAAAAQIVMQPDVSNIPAEPPPESIDRAVLENRAAQGDPLAQWLLMRWYDDYQGLIEFDASNELVKSFLGAGVYCVGRDDFISLLEALELKVSNRSRFGHSYVVELERNHHGEVLVFHERIDSPNDTQIVELPRRYFYEIGPAAAKFAGAYEKTETGLRPDSLNLDDPWTALNRKRSAYCNRRFEYRQAALEWIKTENE